MKNVLTTAVLFLAFFGLTHAQITKEQMLKGKIENDKIVYHSVSLSVVVDSFKDIDAKFKMEDLISLLADTAENEALTFKITCNGKLMNNGIKSYMSYTVTGNSDESKEFLDNVEKIIESAKKYYKNK